MKKSCMYCGRIVERNHICPLKEKLQKKKTVTDVDKFRWSIVWQRKRDRIRERDNYLCRVCLEEKMFTYDNIEVHHIVPIAEDYDKRLDDDNLICLCAYHHSVAERGEIERDRLRGMVPPGG